MQYYPLTTNACIIDTPNYTGFITPEEMDAMEVIERGYQKPKLTDREIAKVFPVAKSTIKRLLKEEQRRLAQCKTEYQLEEDVYKVVEGTKERERMLESWIIVYNQLVREPIIEKINHYERLLFLIDPPETNGKGVEEADIERARQVPIETFIKFQPSGFAKSIWVEEKTASMKLYRKDNRVWCFSSNKGGDVIDVVMQLNNLSFLEAVNYLNNGN